MNLSPRRFRHVITRRRQEPGHFDGLGEYVEGMVVEKTLRANVQPLLVEDEDLEGGVQLVGRFKVFVPVEDALVAAFEDRQADRVLFDGDMYVVEESRSWKGSHTRATLLRET